ncbi:hypothetical protein Bbelb_248500 [Branchiostoma belcheri]|nr:hypothetical protein Bbelb_248500 [Branchiostoma belcheri]
MGTHPFSFIDLVPMELLLDGPISTPGSGRLPVDLLGPVSETPLAACRRSVRPLISHPMIAWGIASSLSGNKYLGFFTPSERSNTSSRLQGSGLGAVQGRSFLESTEELPNR